MSVNNETAGNESIASISNLGGSNKKEATEQRNKQRERRFKKESTIYGIPVKNTSRLDYS